MGVAVEVVVVDADGDSWVTAADLGIDAECRDLTVEEEEAEANLFKEPNISLFIHPRRELSPLPTQ